MILINCEINLTLTWSSGCAISAAAWKRKVEITDRKNGVPVVT